MQLGRKNTEQTYEGGEGRGEEKQEVVGFRKDIGEEDKSIAEMQAVIRNEQDKARHNHTSRRRTAVDCT